MATFIVQGTLKHDNVTYKHGAEFESDDAELTDHLRRVGALALPGDALPAEAIAEREAHLQARIAELEAQAAQAATDKSGEDRRDEEE